MNKKITVFGSGLIEQNSKERRIAYEVGFRLAQAGFILVNGGYDGAMAASAEGAKKAGGKTIGVTTKEFRAAKKNAFIDREIQMPSWKTRLHRLIECSDGFIVLDGGTGTFVELFVVWEMLNKDLHQKPVVVLGKEHRALLKFLHKNQKILFPNKLYFAKIPQTAIDLLIKYTL